MATNNAVNSGLSGTTGTGNFVGSTSPSLTTPKVITGINDTNGNQLIGVTATGSAVNSVQLVNAATANNPSLSATGSDSNITLLLKGKGTGGAAVLGTSTNDSAGAGYVGEVISSQILFASAVSLASNGSPSDITSISLTAGDWDVYGNVSIIAGTTPTTMAGWISVTSATVPDFSLYTGPQNSVTLSGNQSFTVPFIRVNVSSTTPVYLSAASTFSSGSSTASGGIFARRAR